MLIWRCWDRQGYVGNVNVSPNISHENGPITPGNAVRKVPALVQIQKLKEGKAEAMLGLLKKGR